MKTTQTNTHRTDNMKTHRETHMNNAYELKKTSEKHI